MELRAISCILGAVLINLTLGTFYSIGNVTPYLASYMREHGNPNVSIESGTYITATFLLGQALFIIAGSWIESYYNSRIATIVGCVIYLSSTFLIVAVLDTNFVLVVLFYGLGCGLGTGSAYMAAIIAAQKWFPLHKGIFTGIIVAGFGLGGLVFTSLQTLFLNPDNTLANKSGYFPQSVAERVPNMFLYMGLMFCCLQTVGCFLSFPPPETAIKSEQNANTIVSDDALPDVKTYYDIFKYKVAYIVCLMFTLLSPGLTFVNSLGKQYGQIYVNDDKFLSRVIAVCAVANASGRLFWGFLLDKTSFTICFTAKVILFTIFILLFPSGFILDSKVLYLINMLALFFSFSASFVLFPVYIEQVFGIKYYGMVYGTIYIFFAVAGILTSIFIENVMTPRINSEGGLENYTTRFLPCIMIAVLYVLSLILYFLCLPTRRIENGICRRREIEKAKSKETLYHREDLLPMRNLQAITQAQDSLPKENSLGSIVKYKEAADVQPRIRPFHQ